MTKQIKLGILGLGTVGTGTVEVLTEHAQMLTEKTDAQLVVEQVLVRDIKKHASRQFKVINIQDKLTDNPWDIIYNNEIDIVVELMGGEEPSLTYMKDALTAGKHVVTANKEVIANHGKTLSSLANSSGVNLLYEASVAGGVPVIRPLNACLAGNQITEIQGILNGTTNFILTKMETSEAEFDEMLTKAQELGYAESDPTDDIGGFDAVRKLAILTSLSTGAEVLPDDIYTEGIDKINSHDVKFLNKQGYTVKLLGQTKIQNSTINSRVAPTFLAQDNPLAGVSDVYNSVSITGDPVGSITMTGEGAGKEATSSAVIADIIELARSMNNMHPNGWGDREKYKLLPVGESESMFYTRLSPKSDNGSATVQAEQLVDEFKQRHIQVPAIESETDSKVISFIAETVQEQIFRSALEEIADKYKLQIDNIIRGE